MKEDFDREFYRSRWQRVLPLGPDGIQPYVRAQRGPGRTGTGSALRRLRAMFTGMVQGAIARWADATTAWLFGNIAAPGRQRHVPDL